MQNKIKLLNSLNQYLENDDFNLLNPQDLVKNLKERYKFTGDFYQVGTDGPIYFISDDEKVLYLGLLDKKELKFIGPPFKIGSLKDSPLSLSEFSEVKKHIENSIKFEKILKENGFERIKFNTVQKFTQPPTQYTEVIQFDNGFDPVKADKSKKQNNQVVESGILKKRQEGPINVVLNVFTHPNNPNVRYFLTQGYDGDLKIHNPITRIEYKDGVHKKNHFALDTFGLDRSVKGDVKNTSKVGTPEQELKKLEDMRKEDLLELEKILVTDNGFKKTGGTNKNDPIKYINEDLNLGYELTSSGRNVISFNPHENYLVSEFSTFNWRSGKTLKEFNEEVQGSIESAQKKLKKGDDLDKKDKGILQKEVDVKIERLKQFYQAVNDYYAALTDKENFAYNAFVKEARLNLVTDEEYKKYKKLKDPNANRVIDFKEDSTLLKEINSVYNKYLSLKNPSKQEEKDGVLDAQLLSQKEKTLEEKKALLQQLYLEAQIYYDLKNLDKNILKYQEDINKDLKILGKLSIVGIQTEYLNEKTNIFKKATEFSNPSATTEDKKIPGAKINAQSNNADTNKHKPEGVQGLNNSPSNNSKPEGGKEPKFYQKPLFKTMAVSLLIATLVATVITAALHLSVVFPIMPGVASAGFALASAVAFLSKSNSPDLKTT